jgi:hypothetical protein
LVRKARRALARLDTPTPAEAARATLANKALHLALANRALTVKEIANHLNSLIAEELELREAAVTLQTDLLSGELRRIAREAIAKAPDVRRLIKGSKGR